MLALGCSISGSGLEQLSALIVRLMARQAGASGSAGPHSQGHREHCPLYRAVSRDALLASVERED